MGERVDFENEHGGPIDAASIGDERFAAIYQMLNEMQCGLIVLDRRGAIFGSNTRLRGWLGLPREEPMALRGRMATEIIAPELHDRFEAHRKRIDAGDLRAFVTILRRMDGTTFPVIYIPQRVIREGWEELESSGILVDLATIQTAESGDARTPTDVCSTLDRVAIELRAISLSLSADARVSVPVGHPEFKDLSDREMEVLVQLAAGRRVPAIAKALYISPNTVRNHLKAVYRKLGVHSQVELLEKVQSLASDDPRGGASN